MDDMMGGPWMMLVWLLIVLAVLAAAAYGIAWLIRGTTQRGERPGRDDAEELLRRRYAAGEIDHDEYERAELRRQ
jgi:putative membrane protein